MVCVLTSATAHFCRPHLPPPRDDDGDEEEDGDDGCDQISALFAAASGSRAQAVFAAAAETAAFAPAYAPSQIASAAAAAGGAAAAKRTLMMGMDDVVDCDLSSASSFRFYVPLLPPRPPHVDVDDDEMASAVVAVVVVSASAPPCRCANSQRSFGVAQMVPHGASPAADLPTQLRGNPPQPRPPLVESEGVAKAANPGKVGQVQAAAAACSRRR